MKFRFWFDAAAPGVLALATLRAGAGSGLWEVGVAPSLLAGNLDFLALRDSVEDASRPS
ncbi:hypothetical protein ACFC5Z_00515 [Streptomyces sp. NPDC056004]|uniref:hypothetical protein n=1 Tax=unclassified Streptomyces TaxID=2593676 RepID=UPI0035D6FB5C